ncbi:MAG TPA: hypothetical protein VG406_11310 [Isosphaeraceae bacterium]|nr:hypothetical protein [Isosphaeraceae bacterium]
MDEAGVRTWFVGDLGDPWVGAIAAGLPGAVETIDAPGDLPESWPDLGGGGTLVLHRAGLSRGDAARLRRLREGPGGPERVVLVIGPQGRYHQWDAWETLVDASLFEATAAATIARYLAAEPPMRPTGPRPAVAVVGGERELARTLAESCARGGFEATVDRDGRALPAGGIVVAVVPTLEPDWPEVLAAWARGRRVVALLGFADRPTVARAFASGALACLDLPCDPDDLAFVLDRLAPRVEPAHALPPGPKAARFGPRGAVAGANGRA